MYVLRQRHEFFDLALRLIELLRLADGALLRLIIFQRRGADGHGDGAQHQNDDEHIDQRVTAGVCSEFFHAPPPSGTARTYVFTVTSGSVGLSDTVTR